jgi:hypothetical protein
VNKLIAWTSCVVALSACIGQPEDINNDAQTSVRASVASLVTSCTGQPYGTECARPGGGNGPDQCDGTFCADCVDDNGCMPGYYCDAFDEVCYQGPRPPPPPPLPPGTVTSCYGASYGTLCVRYGYGGQIDQCDAYGNCVECVTDAGCPAGTYCDAFDAYCYPAAPPPALPPPAPSDTSLGETCRASWVDLSN